MKTKFVELKKVFDALHGPRGCMWDKEQTHNTLIPYLKEEVGEFIEALKAGDETHVKEELGDILLQVMFHSKLSSKEGGFDIEDVIDCLIKKLKRRHPHIFAKVKVGSVEEIISNWHKIKKQEKEADYGKQVYRNRKKKV